MKTKPVLMIESGTICDDKRYRGYGRITQVPTGSSTKILLDGKDISQDINYVSFKVHADSVAWWTIAMKKEPIATTIKRKLCYLKCRLKCRLKR